MHPVGPESERVYWVRRGIVAAVLVVVLAMIAWLLATAFGSGSSPTAGGAVSQRPTASAPAPSRSPASPVSAGVAQIGPNNAPAITATPRPTAKQATSDRSVTTPVCTGGDVALRILGTHRVRVGETTSLYLAIVNTGPTRCKLDMSKNFQVTVTSGTDRIWSTQDCTKWSVQGTLTLVPGKPYRFAVNWPTQRSSASCQLGGPALLPGTYVATVRVPGADAHQNVMQLVG